jgi:hypothetical protein
MIFKVDRRTALRLSWALAPAGLIACATTSPLTQEATEGQPPDATVEMRLVRAPGGTGETGSGILYRGFQNHPFTVTGGGIGGQGASEIEVRGVVYRMREVSRFAGAYHLAPFGFVESAQRSGDLWLANEAGVVMHLRARRPGQALTQSVAALAIAMG